MAEHEYAQVLRWIADGKEVQFSHPDVHGWLDLTQLSQPALSSFFAGENGWEFRLKPRTITIAGRQIEEPVDAEYALKNRSTCYVVLSDGGVRLASTLPEFVIRLAAQTGFVFAREDAGLRALEAIKAALKGADNA